MRLLLDTHIFLWWANEPERLSEAALTALTDPANPLLLSVAAAWEMQIKIQVGKLRLRRSLKEVIARQQRANGIQLLPVELSHVLALTPLPLHHRDPFDRLMIAQALDEGLTLVSAVRVGGACWHKQHAPSHQFCVNGIRQAPVV